MNPPASPPNPPASPPNRPAPELWLITLAFVGFTALLATLYALSRSVGFFGRYLTEIYAVLFLMVPHLWHARTGFPFPRFGRILPGIFWGVGVSVGVLGLFVLGYVLYFRGLCMAGWSLPPLGRTCDAFHAFAFPGMMTVAHLFLIHLIAVSLPEEYFYRGFLLPLVLSSPTLEKWSPRTRVALAVFIQAVFFSIGHAFVDFNPLRAAVFFPGLLFGAMMIRSQGLWAPILFHAAANVVSETIERGFFG